MPNTPIGSPQRRLAALVLAAAMAWAMPSAVAEEASGPQLDLDAASVLTGMSKYLGGLQSFSADYAVETEILSEEGQKLQFVSHGAIEVQRPGKMHVTRQGMVADIDFILDGVNLSIVGRKANVYFQAPAQTIEQAIGSVRDDIGFDAPGADLLLPDPLNNSATDIVSGQHVGMAILDGISVHHLAFRGKVVDWQLWVADGDKPLPVKYVITSKWVTAAPQYSIAFRNWNTEPTFADTSFVFTPPAGARQIENFAVDAMGQADFGEGEPE